MKIFGGKDSAKLDIARDKHYGSIYYIAIQSWLLMVKPLNYTEIHRNSKIPTKILIEKNRRRAIV